MKRLPAVLAGAGMLLVLAFNPAWAIDAQPGGPSHATATIGAPTTDDNDVTVDRCECDGGPLEAITVHTRSRDEVVRRDRLEGQPIVSSDGVRVGLVTAVSNTDHEAIVLIVQLEDGLIGDFVRIAVRRTAFYYDDGAIVINTTMADLAASVTAAAAGAGA